MNHKTYLEGKGYRECNGDCNGHHLIYREPGLIKHAFICGSAIRYVDERPQQRTEVSRRAEQSQMAQRRMWGDD